jgi:hypothetical protein
MHKNWQNRIYNHEETPPKGMWDSIAKELDKKENEKKNIEKKTVKIAYLKWAVAASFLLALISIAIVYTNKKTEISEVQALKKDKTVSDKPVAQNTHLTKPEINIIPKNDTLTLKTAPFKSRKINSPFRKKQEENNLGLLYAEAGESKPLVKNPVEANKKKLTTPRGEVLNDISLMESPNSYVSFIGPNGQEVKISAKFSNIIGYLNNPETEEYLDKVISEGSYWRGKFKEWRDKMSDNKMAPSPSNFMDIIEMGNILSENK